MNASLQYIHNSNPDNHQRNAVATQQNEYTVKR